MAAAIDLEKERLQGQVETAVSLLMNCIPHLDLQVSGHRDGFRLRRDICLFLAGLGYAGWLRDRPETTLERRGPSVFAKPRVQEAKPHG